MLISFIVLSYNQEKMIYNAIKSILYSRIFNYEIIIVDNNSIDIPILHKNIKIITNRAIKNQSISRNLGIKCARGKHIIFLDGDDYFIPSNINNIINYIKNYNYDIYFQNRYYEDNNLRMINIFDLSNVVSAGICHYIIKRLYLLKNNILFEEKKFYYYSEDIPFLIKLLEYNPQYCFNNSFHYVGIKNPSSTDYKNVDKKQIMMYYIDMNKTFSKYKNKHILYKLTYKMIKFLRNG